MCRLEARKARIGQLEREADGDVTDLGRRKLGAQVLKRDLGVEFAAEPAQGREHQLDQRLRHDHEMHSLHRARPQRRKELVRLRPLEARRRLHQLSDRVDQRADARLARQLVQDGQHLAVEGPDQLRLLRGADNRAVDEGGDEVGRHPDRVVQLVVHDSPQQLHQVLDAARLEPAAAVQELLNKPERVLAEVVGGGVGAAHEPAHLAHNVDARDVARALVAERLLVHDAGQQHVGHVRRAQEEYVLVLVARIARRGEAVDVRQQQAEHVHELEREVLERLKGHGRDEELHQLLKLEAARVLVALVRLHKQRHGAARHADYVKRRYLVGQRAGLVQRPHQRKDIGGLGRVLAQHARKDLQRLQRQALVVQPVEAVERVDDGVADARVAALQRADV
eukprot:Unigene4426_Nuclearia_a/m.13527 Unigene4426_Nuclearia_a/g.13527  ORF Unigene4426_Nuclearia_a/g.13527 Unigene4426_Nuclearia_a/m.13527 type:complete len:394 (+) Unigene4426_Nuclearia_a:805-1986(+)